MTTLDATNLILGRLCSHAAKKALIGETIDIVNCEKAMVTGDRYSLFDHYYHKMKRGTFKGPFFYKQPHLFVKRTIRGMLPHKTDRGLKAFKRVKCHIGVPPSIKEGIKTLKEADISKVSNLKYVSLGDICRHLGWKP